MAEVSMLTRQVTDPGEIETPALVVDLSTVQRNIERMASYAQHHSLSLRPHTKTHKSLFMGNLQMQAGAIGLTAAKLGESEVMSEIASDLLVAYPTVDSARAQRVANLAARGKTVRVAVDSLAACDAIALAAIKTDSTIGILVDLDVGFHRTGVQDAESSLKIAKYVERTSSLRLDGIMCFPGHVNQPPEEQAEPLEKVDREIHEVVDLWRDHGLEASIVSGGSTPTARQSHHVSALTEIRPGMYLFNDWNLVDGQHCTVADCAARVSCTVVSDAVPGKVVIDAGSKTLASDRHSIGQDTESFGFVVEYPTTRVVRLSEEHGEIDISQSESRPTVGERVHVIPNHICPVVNLQEHLWLKRSDTFYEKMSIDARGHLS